jgi:hypothetical protein
MNPLIANALIMPDFMLHWVWGRKNIFTVKQFCCKHMKPYFCTHDFGKQGIPLFIIIFGA